MEIVSSLNAGIPIKPDGQNYLRSDQQMIEGQSIINGEYKLTIENGRLNYYKGTEIIWSPEQNRSLDKTFANAPNSLFLQWNGEVNFNYEYSQPWWVSGQSGEEDKLGRLLLIEQNGDINHHFFACSQAWPRKHW